MARRNQVQVNHRNRWTAEEDTVLLRHIKARPQNLHYCFAMASEVLGRTEGAVAAHWYQSLSKKPEALCFFTASPVHVSRNRKNGEGVPYSSSIWRRLINALRNII